MTSELFWWGMTMFCVAWYSTITIYVAVRGSLDIRTMLNELARQGETERGESIAVSQQCEQHGESSR